MKTPRSSHKSQHHEQSQQDRIDKKIRTNLERMGGAIESLTDASQTFKQRFNWDTLSQVTNRVGKRAKKIFSDHGLNVKKLSDRYKAGEILEYASHNQKLHGALE